MIPRIPSLEHMVRRRIHPSVKAEAIRLRRDGRLSVDEIRARLNEPVARKTVYRWLAHLPLMDSERYQRQKNNAARLNARKSIGGTQILAGLDRYITHLERLQQKHGASAPATLREYIAALTRAREHTAAFLHASRELIAELETQVNIAGLDSSLPSIGYVADAQDLTTVPKEQSA